DRSFSRDRFTDREVFTRDRSSDRDRLGDRMPDRAREPSIRAPDYRRVESPDERQVLPPTLRLRERPGDAPERAPQESPRRGVLEPRRIEQLEPRRDEVVRTPESRNPVQPVRTARDLPLRRFLRTPDLANNVVTPTNDVARVGGRASEQWFN